MELQKIPKRCCFCYEILNSDQSNWIFCPDCKKRSYCSAFCRESDAIGGQCHSYWCLIGSGEEDFEWEVSYINSNKDYGVIAKKDIPKGYRIMVERNFTDFEHSAYQELSPISGTTNQKKQTNCLGSDLEPFACIRLSRVNHSCKENAFHWRENNVKLLISNTDIKKGEEITINYTLISDPTSEISLEDHEKILYQNWGIICPSDCNCKKSDFKSTLLELKEKHSKIPELISNGLIEEAIKLCENVEELIVKIGNDPKNLSRLYYYYFQACVSKKEFLSQAKKYAEKKYEIALKMYGPNSNETRKIQRYLNNPTYHPIYLIYSK